MPDHPGGHVHPDALAIDGAVEHDGRPVGVRREELGGPEVVRRCGHAGQHAHQVGRLEGKAQELGRHLRGGGADHGLVGGGVVSAKLAVGDGQEEERRPERGQRLEPDGVRAAREERSPESCWRVPRRSTVMAASARMSLNARQLAWRRSTARCASGAIASRRGGSAVAHPDATATTSARLLRRLRALTFRPAEVGLHVLDLGLDPGRKRGRAGETAPRPPMASSPGRS